MQQIYDVIVVGAGPAGATLACELARKGIRILLLEKERQPRHKCCAGGVTARAASLLDFDISEAVEDTVCDVSVTCGSGTSYSGHSSEPLIFTVMRDVFDHLLAKRAQQSGAFVLDGHAVTQVRTTADWMEVSTTDSVFRSRIVAGADGVHSVVARKLGMKTDLRYAVGIEKELVVTGEEQAKRKSRVDIDIGSVPGGYAWMFPKRKHLSTGAGCIASKSRELNGCYQKFLDSQGISNYTAARVSRHLIPTCGRRATLCQGRALLLGDAAGFADPLTGEGIYHAVLSAQLAAPVIERALTQDKIELQEYQNLVTDRILSELAIAGVLSGVVARVPGLLCRMLNSDDGVWRACCRLLRGETSYGALKENLGGLRGMLAFLSRAYQS